jgi:CHAT domain-containing protein
MRRFVLVGAAAAAVFVAVLVTTLSGASGPLHELSRAAPARTFAPRLSISTPYRPCTTLPVRASETVPREDCGPAQDAVVDVLGFEAGGESAAPDSLRVAALAALIWWDETEDGSLDEAISRLDRARRLTLDPVPALVDLSAAYLLRAERTQNPRDLYEALEHARLALEHDPRNLPALWNAALATQAMHLYGEAAEAWDAYLAADGRSAWADEAERRKHELLTEVVEPVKPTPGASAAEVQAFARNHPREARILGWTTALGDWGRAVEKGDSAQAALHLAFAEDLGRALEQRPGGDASLMAAVRAIRGAPADDALLVLARAHRAYAVVESLIETQQFEAAEDSLGPVAPARRLSPVLAQWADLSEARIAGTLSKHQAADAGLLRLLTQVDSARYPALAGIARLTRGNVLVRGPGRYLPAREQFRIAVNHLRRAGEAELLGAAYSSDGEAAHLLADTVKAYELMHEAQRVLSRDSRPVKLHNQLHGLARMVVLDGMPRSALAILDEDVRVGQRAGAGLIAVDALQARARVRAILGDSSGVAADLDSAGARLSRRRDGEVMLKWSVSVMLLAKPGQGSPADLDSAVEYLVASNLTTWGLPALMRRADARLANNDVAGATADLEAVVAAVRTLSSRTGDAALRHAMLEQARTRFNRLVMLYLRLGKPEEALQTLEQGRVSFAALGDSARVSGTGLLRAPAGQVALEYALIGDTLLTWVVRANTIHLERQLVDREAFLLAVEQTGAALESRARVAGARPGLRRLYDWLIRPVRSRLGPRDTPLVILADGEIAGVPFAALLNSEGRYLVEDYPIRYAATLADAARPVPASRGPAGPVLLVADPAFDQLRHPTLDRLGGARTEVDSLQRLFPVRVRLDDVHATREAFAEKAQSASLIHYAGHAIFDDARPERSFLVLAGADTTGRLAAESVSGMRLGGVRLVVLSACRTLRSRGGRSGGFAGLSGALLSAGAGGVVGSLWQVSDGRAQPLMMAFHREYQKNHGDAALALREAQVQMLRSGGSLGTWAGFRYAGN